MACCPRENSQAGYATPAALVLSLALALVGSATVVGSVQMLRLTRADLELTKQEFALDGAHFEAVAQIVRSGVPGPYAWTMSSDVGWMQVVAEPEADKLSFAAAAALDAGALSALGVARPEALKARLAQAAADDADVAVGGLDPAPLWSACGPSLASPLGQQDRFRYVRPREPGLGADAASWRVGEAWRVSIATSAGWRDDRIVRFTGNARHPTAVVARRLTRGGDRGGECASILSDFFGG